MLLVAVEFRVEPDRAGEFSDAARDLSDPTRRETGCRRFEFWADLEGSGRFLVFEEWAGADDLRAHRETPHVAAFREAVSGLGAEMVRVARYQASEAEV